jgi:MFS family permease
MKHNSPPSREIMVLLAASFLSTFGIFLALPIISLHAYKTFQLSTTEVGVLSGIWPATVFCLSFVCGMLSDRFGSLLALRFAAILNTVAFFSLAVSPNLATFSLGLFLFGIGKSFFDSSIRAAMVAVCAPEQREKYFRIRYTLQNTGCMLGPLAGVFAYRLIDRAAFALTSLSYMFAFALFLIPRTTSFPGEASKHGGLLEKLRVVGDLRLFWWILSGTFLLMSYGAYESFMPIIAEQSSGARPSFGILVSLNAGIVVLCQVIHLRWFQTMPVNSSITLGFILMVAGFLFFAVDYSMFFMTLVAVMILSIGEGLLFPCFEVLLDRIAPQRQKALYYGAGELKQIGFFIGPLIGGVLMQKGGYVLLFLCCAAWVGLGAASLAVSLGLSLKKSDLT